MTLLRMDHVGINFTDLDAAVAFFVELGFELQGEWSGDDPAVGRIIGLEGARTDVAMLNTPDGHAQLELIRFREPSSPAGDTRAPAHTPGLRHLTFAVKGLDDVLARLQARGAELMGELVEFGGYRLCYLRGPEGIILEVAEKLD